MIELQLLAALGAFDRARERFPAVGRSRPRSLGALAGLTVITFGWFTRKAPRSAG